MIHMTMRRILCPSLVTGVLESLLQPEERKGSVGQEVKILSQNQPKIIQRPNYLVEIIMIGIMIMINNVEVSIIMDPNDRFEEQSHEIKEAQEKMSEIVLAKQVQLHHDDDDEERW